MKANIRKKIIFLLLALAVIVPLIVGFFQTNNKYDFKISEYTMDVVLDEYGDMHVVESVTNKYNNKNTVFFKDLIYAKNNSFSTAYDKSSLVEDVRLVVEDSSGIVFDTNKSLSTSKHFVGYSYNYDIDERGLPIRCSDHSISCEQILYYDANGISKETTFTYYYTIKGVVTEYNDISEFNWVMLDTQPMNVHNVKITITLPEGNYNIKDMDTYFHGTSFGKREFVDNNKIVITAKKLVSAEKIETRLLLDKSVFTSIRDINKFSENRKAELIDFEESQMKFWQIITLIFYWGSIGIYALAVFYLIMLTQRCYRKYDREFKSEFYNEYYREIPADYSPAVMGYLYNFKQVGQADLTATILDLVRRKYLIFKNKSTSVNDDDPDYELWLNKEMDLNELREHERYLIKWFINDIGDDEKVTSEDLDGYCDVLSNAENYQNKNHTWVKLVEKEAEKYNFFDKKTYKAKGRFIFYGTATLISIGILKLLHVFLGYNITIQLLYSLWILLFAYIFYVATMHRRTKQGNEDFVRWRAFKHFLEDFSNFEDYPVPSLIIWEHYLVYATSFGIADKVMKQLRVKFDINVVDNPNCTFIVYYNHVGRLNSNINHAKNSAISTINRYNSSRSNGSFGGGRSGGGFSGGSSFGGGGGSFGGR